MPFCLTLVLFMLFGNCMLRHYHLRCLMPALLLTIWGFDAFQASIHQFAPDRRKMSWIDSPVKISDLGSNVCGTVLIWSVFFHLFSLKSMPGVMPVYFSGGHSIWVNVRCYFTSCTDKCGKKNLICMTGAIWSQPDMYMDSIAPLIFLFIFSNVAFFQSPKERCCKMDVFLVVLLLFLPVSTEIHFF